jgi:hypothetical protein
VRDRAPDLSSVAGEPAELKKEEKSMNEKIKTILSHYRGENPGVRTNLARILNHGTWREPAAW